MSDRFAVFAFVCPTCRRDGCARVWVRPGDTEDATAARHSTETRAACVNGCRYHATAKSPLPKAVYEATE